MEINHEAGAYFTVEPPQHLPWKVLISLKVNHKISDHVLVIYRLNFPMFPFEKDESKLQVSLFQDVCCF
jgi:hypothetical protein